MLKISSVVIIFFALACALSACTTLTNSSKQESTQEKQIDCKVDRTQAVCILAAAKEVFNSIEDDFASVSSAAELASAQDSLGNTAAAWNLLEGAVERSESITDDKALGAGLSDVLTALATVKPNIRFGKVDKQLSVLITALSDKNKQMAMLSALIVARAAQGSTQKALADALTISEEDDYSASQKGLALRRIATQFAIEGDVESARSTLERITMGLSYYQIMAHADVARAIVSKGETGLAKTLLENAYASAQNQDNGYFIAAVLRDIAYSYIAIGDSDRAKKLFREATSAARMAIKPNEKARAMSRIATRMADSENYVDAAQIIAEAEHLQTLVESPPMRTFAQYEIAGSAAFSGEFTLAQTLIGQIPDIPFGAAASVRDSTNRDLAWGLAKHGKISQGLDVANSITNHRERIQALSRIIRLLQNPKMTALPRYL